MEEEQKAKRGFPTKKDLYYIIAFLIFLIIMIFTLKFEDPKYLTEQLSLGATLFSIFLAVIAILITFIQSNESSRQSSQMSRDINNQSVQLAKMIAISDLMSKQQDVNEETSEKIAQKIQGNNKIPKELREEILKLVEEGKDKQVEILQEKSIIDNTLSKNSNINRKRTIKMMLDFIQTKYNLGVLISVETLKRDLLIQNQFIIQLSTIRECIRELSSQGYLRYEYLADSEEDYKVTMFFKRLK
ncbi:hypothetical protein ABES58_06310 [Paenibacillus lautus]|uniref:hypothetical protein n=1 Tax=Paenibacillus lautus TaxID=1401 RepID=UPI003D2B83F6